MRNDTRTWMEGAAERSIRALLMTAEELTRDNESLDADDTEQLHWCWEGIHHIAAAKLATAQMEAHTAAADKQPTTNDLARMLADMKAMMESKAQTEAATTR